MIHFQLVVIKMAIDEINLVEMVLNVCQIHMIQSYRQFQDLVSSHLLML